MLEWTWVRTARRWRFLLFALLDILLWAAALYLAALARYGFDPMSIVPERLAVAISVAVVTQLVVGSLAGLYRGRWAIASFDEVLLVVGTSTAAGLATLVAVLVAGDPNLVPISSVMAATAYQLLGALGIRYLTRLVLDVSRRSHHPREHRTLIFGAGSAGRQIIGALQRDTTTDLDPVGLLDDDPTKRRLRIRGVRVLGDRRDIAAVATTLDADTILLAIPSASQQTVTDLADAGIAAGLRVKVLPPLSQLSDAGVAVRDIRDMRMSDFLSRDEVDIDMASVRAYLTGKRVLVTGAGGSIGSVLCRTIQDFEPSRLVMVDHDENALQALEITLQGHGLLMSPDIVLCDIRDEDAVRTVFEATHPHVVFHAAAHKHLPLLERHPSEGHKTNVEGTRHVLAAAVSTGVDRFVNISTDKAADPVSVLGRTKREAELLTAATDRDADGVYLSVRFGNVLGSNGSVVPTFLRQATEGVPLTVTDPEATRFFMTVEEAVLLVLQAGALGEGGDVLVLEMGEPVRIMDVARRIAHQVRPGEPPEIVVTGLRPGEKLHEVLTSEDETALDSPHPRLRRYRVGEIPVP